MSSSSSKFDRLVVAWCGDTQMCLTRDGAIKQPNVITSVHKPDSSDEKERIEREGGCVSYLSNAWRINGSLSVSRSFGDVDYQPCVIATPDILNVQLESGDEFIVIGCDGLWEALTFESVNAFVRENLQSNNLAELLALKAKDEGSLDNITVIFIQLKSY